MVQENKVQIGDYFDTPHGIGKIIAVTNEGKGSSGMTEPRYEITLLTDTHDIIYVSNKQENIVKGWKKLSELQVAVHEL